MKTDEFITQFSSFVNEHKLFSAQDKLIVACSGGIDSVVLVDVLHKLDYHFSIAHCNFKLRNEDAELDEHFVHSLALKYKVPFYRKEFDTLKIAQQLKKGIQETARIIRYEWFYELATETQSTSVLTAHHFNDSVETFFINLLRGSGISGLAGIAHSYRIFKRPLIPFKKEEIEKYAQQNQIRFRLDSSNEKDDYLRNRLRHHLMPLLEDVSDKGLSGILKSIQYLSNERKIVHFAIDLINEQSRLKTDTGKILFDLQHLAKLDLLEAALYHLLAPYYFNSNQCLQIIQSFKQEHSGKYFYSHKYKILLNRNILEIIDFKEPEIQREYIISTPGQIEYPINLSITLQKTTLDYQSNTNQNIAYINPDALVWPLKLRHWQEGDGFAPLGMKGEKKISDYFIDEKISVSEKHQVWLLENGNGKIIWVLGYRIADNVKLHQDTEKMLVFLHR